MSDQYQLKEAATPFLNADSTRWKLLSRALSGLTQVVERMSEDDIKTALEAPTNFGAAAHAIASIAVNVELAELDPAAQMILKGAKLKGELLDKAGGAFGVQQAAEVLHIERQSVDKRRKANAIIAVPKGEDFAYPACQFDRRGGMIAGLSEALKVMPIQDPWMRLEWLLTPDSALDDRSPLEELKAGRAQDVIALAAAQG